MKRVFSSHIDMIGYEPDTKILAVQYTNGRTAHFKDVPPDIANDVVNAASVGQALHAHVRGKFEFSYPGEEDNS